MDNIVPQHVYKKKCTKCTEWFPFTDFASDRKSKDGLAWHCKTCKSKKDQERFRLNPEQKRDANYRANYGITAKQYDRMFIEQGGVCASCGLPETRGPQGRNAKHRAGEIANLSVDHDHETGDVRSLLCGDCNIAFGVMREDPERIQKLKKYADWCQTREPNVKTVQLRLVE
jgi:hypothetical protein